ncbi:30S ribosomal protein S16 [Patescibacteria group bacterium]|nr:30S ribosomal protein S16 [Patescibacteria group bacterium]MBU1126978.1 30S ribosomal protein S16 [Patescibacteria group bacterium]
MVKIRLTRTGKRNAPSYRIVAIDSRSKRDGRPLELIGFYDPKTNPETLKYDAKKIENWIAKGAQLSDTVRKLVNL